MKIIVLILSSISPPREMSLEVAQAISLVRPHEVQSELRKALTSFYYSCTSHVRLVTYLCFFYVRYKTSVQNKTIGDGGITVDFWIIKVHTSN